MHLRVMPHAVAAEVAVEKAVDEKVPDEKCAGKSQPAF